MYIILQVPVPIIQNAPDPLKCESTISFIINTLPPPPPPPPPLNYNTPSPLNYQTRLCTIIIFTIIKYYSVL